MLENAKASYYVNLVESHSNNPRQLWATINSLSGNAKSQVLPDHENITSLVNDFNLFFINKVNHIPTNIGVLTVKSHVSSPTIPNSVAHMSTFKEIKEADVMSIMKSSTSKSCCLDPIPTRVLPKCNALIGPLTRLINLLLTWQIS